MNLKAVKENSLKTFDVVYTSSNKLLGWTIREFIDSDVNHVGILVEIEGKLYISEAEKRGLQLVEWKEYLKTSKYSQFYLGRYKKEIFSNDCVHYILNETRKHKYDFLSLIIFQPIRQITRKLFGKKLWLGKKGKNALTRFTCSEWVAHLYNKYAGEFPEWWANDPGDIKDFELFNIYKFRN